MSSAALAPRGKMATANSRFRRRSYLKKRFQIGNDFIGVSDPLRVFSQPDKWVQTLTLARSSMSLMSWSKCLPLLPWSSSGASASGCGHHYRYLQLFRFIRAALRKHRILRLPPRRLVAW